MTPPASRIAQARKGLGLSQRTLASQLGVSRSAIAQWETGRALPATAHLLSLSETLAMPLNDLLPPGPSAVPAATHAFQLRNLSVLAYANGFTLWHYRLPVGALREGVRADFFADVPDMLAAGDMVMLAGPDGAALRTIRRDCNGRIELGAVW